MEFLNRYIDRPLLRGGSAVMQLWHKQTGHSPQKLSLCGTSPSFLPFCRQVASLSGPIYVFGLGTLLMLSLPSLRQLILGRVGRIYDMRSYQALAVTATRKRETEWAVRLTVLLTAVIFPFCVSAGDEAASSFLLGASLWFVLTAPAKMYLDAAEPPPPGNGGKQAWSRQATAAA